MGALDQRHEFAEGVADVEVHGAVDGLVGREVHFAPMGDPARQAAQGEQHREHVLGDVHQPVDDAGVEIDVRIELPLDEVRIGQRHFFQFLGQIEERVFLAVLGQQLVADFLDDLRPGIVVLVDAMAEAHQAELVVLVLGHVDVLAQVAAVGQDHFEHVDAGLVGPAVPFAPQRADAGGDGRKQVHVARADHAHRRGAAILAVVGVQDQQQVQGVDEIGVHLISFAGHGEHHVQEVLAVGQMVLRIDERLADRLLVAERRDGGHFGQHAVDGQLLLLGIARIERILAVDRQRADDRTEDRHRMGVGRKAGENRLHPLVQQRVRADVSAKLLELLGGGQFAVDQQVGHFGEVAALGDHLDRITAIAEDALFAVEKGDRAAGRAGVGIAFVERDAARWCAATC